MEWKRHDNNIYNKVINWSELIENVVKDPTILSVSVYNIDETGAMLFSIAMAYIPNDTQRLPKLPSYQSQATSSHHCREHCLVESPHGPTSKSGPVFFKHLLP